MFNKIKNNYLNIILTSLGFSALLASNYYFDWYRKFSRTATFIEAFLDVLSLFFVHFVVIFFILFLLKFIKKFSPLTCRFFYCILLSFLSVIFLKTIFDIFGIITFKKILFIIFFNILTFDISYHFKNVISIFFPYFLFFYIFLFFFKDTKNIKRFFFISGNIFLLVFLYREVDYNFLNKEKNKITIRFNYEIKNKRDIELKNTSNKKVIWLLLDSFDPGYVEKYHKDLMPNYNELLSNSFSHKNNYSPARYTINSIPSILMGIPSGGFSIINNKYYLNTKNTFKKHRFIYENTIFGKLDFLDIKSSLFSSVLEYCKSYLTPNNFQNCQDTLTKKTHVFNNTHKMNKVSFSEINKGIMMKYNFIDHYRKINEYLDQYIFIIKLKNIFNNIFGINKIDRKVQKRQPKIKNLSSKEIDFWIKEFNELENIHLNSNDLDGRGSIFYDEIKKELNSNTNLIFIHSMLPHPRTKSSIYCAKYLNQHVPDDVNDEYKLNLICTDLIIKNILKIMSDYKKNYENLMLILSSDHHFRERKDSKENEYPSLLIVKIFNDSKATNSLKKSSSIYIQELIYKYFINHIHSHQDIKEFFKNKEFHVPFYSHH